MYQLESENKRLSQSPLYTVEIEECMKYVDYMLGLLEKLDRTHYAKVYFKESFACELEILRELQQHNYASLLLKSFKYITDMLANVIPHGLKLQLLSNRSSKATDNVSKPQPMTARSRLQESLTNEEDEIDDPPNTERGVFRDVSGGLTLQPDLLASRSMQRM